jgi:hypothetical protein
MVNLFTLHRNSDHLPVRIIQRKGFATNIAIFLLRPGMRGRNTGPGHDEGCGFICLNPNSEIQTGKMTQYLGAETNRKNRAMPEVVCRDFFNSFMPKRLWQIAGFNFGSRAEENQGSTMSRPAKKQARAKSVVFSTRNGEKNAGIGVRLSA